MRTTIDINDALLRELRLKANSTGKAFKTVVNEALASGLAASDKAPQKAVKVRARALGLKPEFTNTSLNQLHDQIEATEQAKRFER
ncbi:MAG: hypothetical protein ACFBZ8_06695 [Opitutales bacterium]